MNDNARYSGLSTLNHWITAMLVVAMWVLGLAAGEAPDAAEDYIIWIHIALGFFVLLFVLWRIGFRLLEGFPEPGAATALERTAATWMHKLLLLVLLVQVLTGPLYLFTEGEGMDVFGWFTFYIPVPASDYVHEAIEEIHKFSGEYLLPILVGVHLLAAAKHWLVDRKAASPREL
ncbi:MAG: cytochrome b/b6 domain-containing protein [Wenzhouxiangellaceae bacterium]|nr:cytochrome b/b6 domain-containing protein [Wenzhouxiangellaceae bacterium]